MLRAKTMPLDPISGLKMSLQMPVRVRPRMASPCAHADAANFGMVRRQAHLLPGFERRSVEAPAAPYEIGVSAGVVEKVELDQLDALVFEIHQRAYDAPLHGRESAGFFGNRRRQRGCIARAPVIGPVHPRCGLKLLGDRAAAAERGRGLHLAHESHVPGIGDGAEAAARHLRAGLERVGLGLHRVRRSMVAAGPDERSG
jgi:hypothetical protein